jgi:transcriptional regulator with XRE-family HTH domain
MRLKLKEHRKSRGWTIDQLADVSGLSRGFISQLENGKRNPGAETLLKLSDTFDAPMAALIEDEGLGADLPALIADLMNLEPGDLAAVRTIVRSMLPASKP